MYWKTRSKKPSKQRKAIYKAPLHKRHKLVSAPLSPELRRQYSRRSFPIRKGDTVLIMRGDFAGVEGKVVKVNLKKMRIYVENATRKKADGTVIHAPIHPSKVMIIKLDLSDKRRKEALERVIKSG
ncbi:MAG: 50S ribosomal protein L24 [Candidatus Methanomethylicia archaeon]|nr:50S ribosomal protein L24 [Candidatus Methanomethylicia archaeon]MCX8168952.1 50S ribosomal protein L24 [Candidatus Methanomethylicia archaeon]MDW7988684.1 50S ribosomal protein L24 [Nitrososphaerota archaeon]